MAPRDPARQPDRARATRRPAARSPSRRPSAPNARQASQNVEATTRTQMTVPPLTRVIGLAPQTRAWGYDSQHRQDAHVGRAGVMPSPLAVHGVEQGQAVDGEVAVQVILGVEDQRNPDQDRPDQAQGQHHPGPTGASTGRGRGGGRIAHGSRITYSTRTQRKKSATAQRKPGNSGKFSRKSPSLKNVGILLIWPIDSHSTPTRIDHPDQRDAGIEVFADFPEERRPGDCSAKRPRRRDRAVPEAGSSRPRDRGQRAWL